MMINVVRPLFLVLTIVFVVNSAKWTALPSKDPAHKNKCYNPVTKTVHEIGKISEGGGDSDCVYIFCESDFSISFYRFFEKWIFNGTMEDPSNELFIEFNECRPKTKHYWDKAYQIKPESVPGFLQGFEQVTLLCGKYTMLLKEFRPNHPLLTAETPSIDVCLSAAQIASLRTKCLAYSERIQLLCGQPISVRDVFERYARSKADYTRQATEKFHENMAKWRADQAARDVEVRAEHARTRAILERQITEVHDRKVQERAESLALDRMYLANEERLEEGRVAEEDRRRQKRIDYYTELGELVDRQKFEANAKLDSLKEMLVQEKAKTTIMEKEIAAIGSESITQGLEIKATGTEDQNKNEVIVLDNSHLDSETTGKLQKSPSDFLNANDNAHDEASYNRMVQMGSTFDFQQHLTASQTVATVRMHDDNSNPILTNATRGIESTREAHMEMVANRNKVMSQQHDIFSQIDTETRLRRPALNSDQMSDLQRNRQKVLTEEYGFATGDKKKTCSEKRSEFSKKVNENKSDVCLEQEVLEPTIDGVPVLRLNLIPTNENESELPFETPMSTSSDTPNRTILDSLALEVKPSLKLDITQKLVSGSLGNLSTAMDQSASSVYESAQSGFYTCAPIDATGFVFPTKHEAASPKSNYKTSTEPSIKKRFFNKTPVQPTLQNVLDELSNPNISSITHSLRMSFVLPLQSHLNVLNNEILKVFLIDLNLIAQFKSLRNYFLMMDGEFASQICHGLLVKLENNATPSEILNFSFLHSLLDSALGSSIMGKDPNAEKLSFIVEDTRKPYEHTSSNDKRAFIRDDTPNQFDLTSPNVLSMLKLSYSIEWPLNLLLSPDTILHYGLIFQHLLKLRRVRFVLDETSQLLKDVAKRAGPKCLRSPQYVHVQKIRNQLLLFINGLQNHITANALQASWRRFKTDLERAQSIEEIYQMHTRYLKRLAFLCMINNSSKDFNNVLDNVWVISLRFYHKLKRYDWQFDVNGIYTHIKYSNLVAIETQFNTLIPYIVHAGEKLARRGYQTEIGDFVAMINFNGFYDRDRK